MQGLGLYYLQVEVCGYNLCFSSLYYGFRGEYGWKSMATSCLHILACFPLSRLISKSCIAVANVQDLWLCSLQFLGKALVELT